jgi:hypothetical protein
VLSQAIRADGARSVCDPTSALWAKTARHINALDF